MWHQAELTLEAPGGLSQPTEPRLLSATQNKEAEVLGRDGKCTGLQSLGPAWLCKARTGYSDGFLKNPGLQDKHGSIACATRPMKSRQQTLVSKTNVPGLLASRPLS